MSLHRFTDLGIGAIPDSALSAMKNHKNLGVHTELIGTGIMDLIRRNVVTCSHKSTDPGKLVSCFAAGSQEFYDFINKNSMFGRFFVHFLHTVHTLVSGFFCSKKTIKVLM